MPTARLHSGPLVPGSAGGGSAALAGKAHAGAGCAPGNARPAGPHTSSGAAHTPAFTFNNTQICLECK